MVVHAISILNSTAASLSDSSLTPTLVMLLSVKFSVKIDLRALRPC